jgi:hypothetical protein
MDRFTDNLGDLRESRPEVGFEFTFHRISFIVIVFCQSIFAIFAFEGTRY